MKKMKFKTLAINFLVLMICSVLITSCEKDETLSIEAPKENPELSEIEIPQEIDHPKFGVLKIGELIPWDQIDPDIARKYLDKISKNSSISDNRSSCPFLYIEACLDTSIGLGCLRTTACGGYQYRCGNSPYVLMSCTAPVDVIANSSPSTTGFFYTLGYSLTGVVFIEGKLVFNLPYGQTKRFMVKGVPSSNCGDISNL